MADKEDYSYRQQQPFYASGFPSRTTPDRNNGSPPTSVGTLGEGYYGYAQQPFLFSQKMQGIL